MHVSNSDCRAVRSLSQSSGKKEESPLHPETRRTAHTLASLHWGARSMYRGERHRLSNSKVQETWVVLHTNESQTEGGKPVGTVLTFPEFQPVTWIIIVFTQINNSQTCLSAAKDTEIKWMHLFLNKICPWIIQTLLCNTLFITVGNYEKIDLLMGRLQIITPFTASDSKSGGSRSMVYWNEKTYFKTNKWEAHRISMYVNY